MNQVLVQVEQYIKQANNILLVAHPNPDGDTSGSVSALYSWLHKEKTVSMFCATPLQEKFSFLPHIHNLKTDPEIFSDHSIDLVIVCDAGDLGYAGIDTYISNVKAPIVNFDHHNTNTFFGTVNVVDTSASSTTSVIYNFLTKRNIPISPDMATALLTGILTDTDYFSNSASNEDSIMASSQLIKKGAAVQKIYKKVVQDKTIQGLKLWGSVLSKLTYHQALDLVYAKISQDDVILHSATDDDADGIANFMNNLSEGSFSLVLKEKSDKQIKGSFRTTRDDIDVSAYAKLFGGGGHKKAAGFTVSGDFSSIELEIISKILLYRKETNDIITNT